MISSALESKTKNTHNKMDKRQLRVALKVMGAVKEQFPDTKKFIEDYLIKNVKRKKISEDEVIFFYKSRSKELAQKKIFYFAVSMLRDIVLS